MRVKGSFSSMYLSLNVPTSPSSALQMTYLGSLGEFLAPSHFMPQGKPAPPRPRNPDTFISLITSSGVIRRAFSRALNPSLFNEVLIRLGSISPQFLNTIFVCGTEASLGMAELHL